MKKADTLIRDFQLEPHPEGGYFKETYRADTSILLNNMDERNVCTSIYYLLRDQERSLFHKIKSDEQWFFHQGEPVEIFCIQDGKLNIFLLGNDIEKGESPHVLIPANNWFAARIKESKGYSFVSCVVSPGFDFQDFELADKKSLLNEYPELENAIEIFCE